MWRQVSWPGWRGMRRSRRPRIRGRATRRGRCGCGGRRTKACCTCTGSCRMSWAPRSKRRSSGSPSRRKPAKGQAWDSFEHRAADALVQLCEQPDTKTETPTLAPRPVVQVHAAPARPGGDRRDPDRRLAASSSCGPTPASNRCWSTTTGSRWRSGSASPSCRRRSCGRCCCATGRCRYGTCETRAGLEVHHLRPRSWGGTDDLANLAAVCRTPPPAPGPPRRPRPGRQPQPTRRTPHSSPSPTSPPNNENRPACHHHAPGPPPHDRRHRGQRSASAR